MSKAGRILLFVMTIFAIAGATNHTEAQTQSAHQNTCSSLFVSKPSCSTDKSVCITPLQAPKQVQSAVITLKPLSTITQPVITQAPVVEPTITTPTANPAPVTPTTVENTTLDSDKIFNMINQYRATLGLTPFEKDDNVCSLAQARTGEIQAEIPVGTLHSGLYNRPLPYWIFENAKYGSNEEGTVAWWLASPLHHQSIVGDYKFSCVKCAGSYCSEVFTSYAPK